MLNGWYAICDYEGLDLFHYVNGKIHNKNSPAEIWEEGCKFWRQNGKRHRLDGPASEYSYGRKEWYYQGKEMRCKSLQEFKRIIKLKLIW